MLVTVLSESLDEQEDLQSTLTLRSTRVKRQVGIGFDWVLLGLAVAAFAAFVVQFIVNLLRANTVVTPTTPTGTGTGTGRGVDEGLSILEWLGKDPPWEGENFAETYDLKYLDD